MIKPWSSRESVAAYLESSVDDSLLLRIPFVSSASIRLRSLALKLGPGAQTPEAIHLFTNAEPPLDFADAEARASLPKSNPKAPAQSIESVALANSVVEYPLRAARFSRVRDVTLYVPRATGAETARIYFVGFKGEFDKVSREGPATIVYESAPRVSAPGRCFLVLRQNELPRKCRRSRTPTLSHPPSRPHPVPARVPTAGGPRKDQGH